MKQRIEWSDVVESALCTLFSIAFMFFSLWTGRCGFWGEVVERRG